MKWPVLAGSSNNPKRLLLARERGSSGPVTLHNESRSTTRPTVSRGVSRHTLFALSAHAIARAHSCASEHLLPNPSYLKSPTSKFRFAKNGPGRRQGGGQRLRRCQPLCQRWAATAGAGPGGELKARGPGSEVVVPASHTSSEI